MSTIRLHPSGQSIDCASDETVLAALERAGYALPNNCRAGACGECKVKVLAGEFDQGIVLDMALAPEERQQGYGLMCMAKPLSTELVIEWATKDAKPKLFPPRENQHYMVTDRQMRTQRIVELRLRPLGQPMRFWPGQYIMLGGEDSEAPPRCYSLANAPRPDGELTIQITKVDDGTTSAWIHEALQVGRRLKLSGPYGTFIGDPALETPVLCLAAGSGLAPILALTEAALRRGYHQPVTLLFSARTKADLYDAGVLSYWQARHRNFRYLPTLTGEHQDGLNGHIPEVLPTLFADLSTHSVFVAGSPPFVDSCVLAAKALGAQEAMIYTEGYFGRSQPEVPAAERLLQERPAPA